MYIFFHSSSKWEYNNNKKLSIINDSFSLIPYYSCMGYYYLLLWLIQFLLPGINGIVFYLVAEMLSLLETTCSFIVTGFVSYLSLVIIIIGPFFSGLVACIYSCLSIAGIFGVKWQMSPMKHP